MAEARDVIDDDTALYWQDVAVVVFRIKRKNRSVHRVTFDSNEVEGY